MRVLCMVAGGLERLSQAPRLSGLRVVARRIEPHGRVLDGGIRILHCDPSRAKFTPTAARINRIAGERPLGAYLEIGVKGGKTFQGVRAVSRVGVDPEPLIALDKVPRDCRIVAKPSDEHFAAEDPLTRYDAVYCDGLHEFEQTYRDVMNALDRLAPGGFVLVDDVVPSSPAAAQRTIAAARDMAAVSDRAWTGEWMGDVFLVVCALQRHQPAIEFRTIVDLSQRPQLLIWRSTPGSPLDRVSDGDLQEIRRVGFNEVFHGGIPDDFRPVPLETAIKEYRRSTTHVV
jgi:hypothetical protein